jgi:hypothetical protein
MYLSQRPKGRDGALTTLDFLIGDLNITKYACDIPLARVVFGSASVLLAIIRVRFSLLREDKPLAHVV